MNEVTTDRTDFLDCEPGTIIDVSCSRFAAPEEDYIVVPRASRPDAARIVIGHSMHSFGQFHRFDGEPIPTDDPELLAWVARTQVDADAWNIFHGVMAKKNAAYVSDDLVFVSHGFRFAHAETELYGVPAVAFVTVDEVDRRRQAAEDAFIEAHPEILASRPAWSDKVRVIDEPTGDRLVLFETDVRDFATVATSALWRDGVVVMDDAICIDAQFDGECDADVLQDLAEGFAELAARFRTAS